MSQLDTGPNIIGPGPDPGLLDRFRAPAIKLTAALGGFLLLASGCATKEGEASTTSNVPPAVVETLPSIPVPTTTDGSPVPIDPELAQAANEQYARTKEKTLNAFQRIFTAMQQSDLSGDTTDDPNHATYSAGSTLYSPVTIDAVVSPADQTLSVTLAMETELDGDMNPNDDIVQIQARMTLPAGSTILDTTAPLSFAELTAELTPANTNLSVHDSYAAIRDQEIKLTFEENELPQVDYPQDPVDPQMITEAEDMKIYGDQFVDAAAEASNAIKNALTKDKAVKVSG